MYALLRAGELGNTVPNLDCVEKWRARPWPMNATFGIRSGVPDGVCILNAPALAVPATFADLLTDGFQLNNSPMVDHMRTAMFNVWESSDGLTVEIVEGKLPG